MAAKSPAKFSMLFLLVACAANMNEALSAAPPAASLLSMLPHGPWESGLPRTRTFPGRPGWKELRQCWAPLQSVIGCVDQIYDALSNARFDQIGPACCKAVAETFDYCWAKLFPFNPSFPPSLKGFCTAHPPSLKST
ncbi:uncharacterized protein [Pyrus communis]|uniref:uncharacterized protein n=1 Tax=Pyrus communis TaxID=23211 RepID=UPI0035C041C5